MLGDKPTNNCHVEPQLLKRFIKDTTNLQLLTTREASESDVDQQFSPVVKDLVYSFTACKHLDTQLSEVIHCTSSQFQYIPASKHTIGVLQAHEISTLRKVYSSLYSNVDIPNAMQRLSAK